MKRVLTCGPLQIVSEFPQRSLDDIFYRIVFYISFPLCIVFSLVRVKRPICTSCILKIWGERQDFLLDFTTFYNFILSSV